MIISPQAVDVRGNPINTGDSQVVGKEDFLRLFVTKLRHQDPLNPMDDGAFIAQLAQFSSLEQLTNMNENLEASIQWDVINNQTINNSVAAQIIGREVEANLSEVALTATNSPKIIFELPEFATDVTVRILDERGEAIRTISMDDVGAGRNDVIWDGKMDDGERAGEGFYTIEISANSATGGLITPSLSIVGVVNGVVYRGGIAFLKIDGAEVSLGDVREINEPAVD